MSKVKELVEQLCPDGVEYKTLGNCISSIRTGLNPRRNFVLNTKDASNFYITVRELDGFKVVPSSKTDLVNDEALRMIDNRSHLSAGDVLFSGVGTVGRTAYIEKKPLNWNIKEGVYAVTSDARVLDSRYMFWFLRSDVARSQFMQGTDGGTVSSLSMAAFKKLNIPVPPIEVQREVVRILDSFQELDDALTAEIEARERQLGAYRDEFLGSRLDGLCYGGVEYKTLGEVAPFVRERADTASAKFDAYVGVDALLQNKEGRDLSKTDIPDGRHIYFRPGDTLLGNIRPYLKKIWFADCFGGTNGDVLVFRATDCIEQRYLYHTLASDTFFDYDSGHAKGSKMPRGDKGFIRDYRIPVPPIDVQQDIVSRLDAMQALIDALRSERDARRRQFVHYRDRLLAFPERG